MGNGTDDFLLNSLIVVITKTISTTRIQRFNIVFITVAYFRFIIKQKNKNGLENKL